MLVKVGGKKIQNKRSKWTEIEWSMRNGKKQMAGVMPELEIFFFVHIKNVEKLL